MAGQSRRNHMVPAHDMVFLSQKRSTENAIIQSLGKACHLFHHAISKTGRWTRKPTRPISRRCFTATGSPSIRWVKGLLPSSPPSIRYEPSPSIRWVRSNFVSFPGPLPSQPLMCSVLSIQSKLQSQLAHPACRGEGTRPNCVFST